MTAENLKEATLNFFPFQAYPQQLALIEGLSRFCTGYAPRDIFLLNGYAGSGKTSIIGALVRALESFKRKTVILAPTGRAAKVASNLSANKASTIHKRIFRADSPEPATHFSAAPNNSHDTIFIVDEASLITDAGTAGQGLLQQLIRYVYSGRNCTMILLGDIAQLPPIGQTNAPAMSEERLRRLGLNPYSFTLDATFRQTSGSGILFNATAIRHLIFNKKTGHIPTLYKTAFEDVGVISGNELSDALSTSWSEVGVDETIIITRSNKRANQYNMAIRNQVMMAEEPLQQGERLMVSKNDYYWSKLNNLPTLIANGDIINLCWVGRTEKMYGRYFTDIEFTIGNNPQRMGAKLMLRSLMAEGPSIPREEMDAFYNLVLSEQEGTMTEQIMNALQDPYYNAVQAKYGYCITCHKSQGGQWKHVYIDMAGIAADAIDETFYRWLYTAITRATEKVFFINPTIAVE
ncbi:MAG: AAA family ATPase [Muribaculaceae bacterium]|nr:AAA family ATPase [Muribaculaceae bacterium]